MKKKDYVIELFEQLLNTNRSIESLLMCILTNIENNKSDILSNKNDTGLEYLKLSPTCNTDSDIK